MNSWKWFRVLLVLSLPIIIVEFLLQHNCASLFIVRLLHNWPVHPCDCALCTFCSLDRRRQLLLIPPTHNNSMLGDAAVKPNKCEKKSRDKKNRPIGRQQQRNLWAVGGTSYLDETSEGTQGLSWPLAPRNNSRCRVVGGAKEKTWDKIQKCTFFAMKERSLLWYNGRRTFIDEITTRVFWKHN